MEESPYKNEFLNEIEDELVTSSVRFLPCFFLLKILVNSIGIFNLSLSFPDEEDFTSPIIEALEKL